MMNHTLIEILFLSIIIILYVLVYLKQIRQNRSYSELVNILSKNINFLLEYNKKKEVIQLQNDIQLYSNFKIISKISKCDYVSFFKYDYSKRYIVLDYLLEINNNGCIIKESSLDKMPISGCLLTSNILNTDEDLYILRTDEIKSRNNHIHNAITDKGINKIYYINIFKDSVNPVGVILISYKNIDFELQNYDKIEILRIIDKIKCCV